MRVINPDDYKELLDETYYAGNIAIPIFTTAFGDILALEEGRYIAHLMYINAEFHILTSGLERFLLNLKEAYFLNKWFRLPKYRDAVERLGQLEHDECFGYVPLLGLGGSDRVENLKKVKLKEHILINVHFLGGIGI